MQGPAAFIVLDDDINMSNDFWGIGPKVGLDTTWCVGCGFRWEDTWCCDRYRTTFDVGWEHHIWYDHVTRLQLSGDYNNQNIIQRVLGFTDFFQEATDMAFGGFVVRARFEF